jgi:hypothetical protein
VIDVARGVIHFIIKEIVFPLDQFFTVFTPRLDMISVTILMIGFTISSEIITINGFIAIATLWFTAKNHSNKDRENEQNAET